jgi:hypothetical protein
MALSEADLERARRAAANAPALSAGQRSQLRAILAGFTAPAQPAGPDAQPGQDGAADAA